MAFRRRRSCTRLYPYPLATRRSSVFADNLDHLTSRTTRTSTTSSRSTWCLPTTLPCSLRTGGLASKCCCSRCSLRSRSPSWVTRPRHPRRRLWGHCSRCGPGRHRGKSRHNPQGCPVQPLIRDKRTGYLDRYLAGEHDAVWAEVTRGEGVPSDAAEVADEKMGRVGRNEDLVIGSVDLPPITRWRSVHLVALRRTLPNGDEHLWTVRLRTTDAQPVAVPKNRVNPRARPRTTSNDGE